jgi:succinyl-diaminopimelate desuccinylase
MQNPAAMNRALSLAEALIARPSVTPDDAGCQELIQQRLAPLGFACESIASGPEHFRVINLWAKRRGARPGPTLVFAGHTDVVPPGPLAQWTSDPFVPTHRGQHLVGRGAADMKSSIAAMVVAVEDFLRATPQHAGAIGFLLTSDEEGPAVDGTVRLVEMLKARGEKLDMCIVGEPTSVDALGDTIKNGRRGTLTGKLTVRGIQGHVAYPQLARNPVHQAAPALAELASTEWDRGNAHFPPTTFQISNIHAGTGVGNVIPGECVIDFNLRFSTESTAEGLRQRIHALLDRHGLEYALAWTLGGQPFLTAPGTLTQAVTAAIESECGIRAQLSTTGGTSDGRFIAAICPQVIELGCRNHSIHKIDECVESADIDRLASIYRRVMENLLS